MNNEEFRQRIASSENDIAIRRFQTEMEEQMPTLKDTKDSNTANETSISQDDLAAKTTSVAQKIDGNIQKAANQFIDLCVLYDSMSWDNPDDTKILRKIEAVAGKYMHNEEFRQRIEASKNEIAMNRLQSEIEEQKQNMSQSMSRGI